MTISAIREFVGLLKQWPAPTTLAVLLCMIAWVAYADAVRHAKAADVRKVQTEVSALQQDVSKLKNDVRDGRAETLEGQMFSAKVEQCKATGDLRRLYAQRVSTLQARYRELTGTSFILPECSEL